MKNTTKGIVRVLQTFHLCNILGYSRLVSQTVQVFSPLKQSLSITTMQLHLLLVDCVSEYCLHALIVSITKITHLSLSSEVFSSHFKHAHVIPLLKKSSLPANDLNSLKPISNLSFISKVLENAESCCLNIHLNCNHLSSVIQFAFTLQKPLN